MRKQLIEIGGQTLHYAEHGPEDATKALIAFNGIGANVEMATPFLKSFKDRRVIIFDAPGVGHSPTPLLPYRLANISRMARKLLGKLGVERVDVFGVSWGGAAAQQFVHDNLDICDSMILAATSAGFPMVPGSIKVLSKMATPKRYSDPEFMTKIGPEIYGGLLRENQELMQEHLGAISHSSTRGYLYQLMAVSGWSSWHYLPKMNIPALILMGSDDPIVPIVNGKMIASRLPNAEFVVMECGHLFVVTMPDETAQTIEDFLQRIENDQPGAACA